MGPELSAHKGLIVILVEVLVLLKSFDDEFRIILSVVRSENAVFG